MASAVLSATAETSLSKPFVVGSCAHWLGKNAEETKSHEWTVYVRLTDPDEDPSMVIKRVVFQLHPTLQPPTRGAPPPLAPRAAAACLSRSLALPMA